MFSDNDQISGRQFRRQVVLSMVGAWLLFLTGSAGADGFSGVLGLGIGLLLLTLWAAFLMRRADALQLFRKEAPRLLWWAVLAVYLSFLVLTGSYLLQAISRICAEYLTAGIAKELLALLLLVTAVVGMGGDMQRRARLAEIYYPFVLAGFVLLLVLAMFHMRAEAFSQEITVSVKAAVRQAYRVLAAGAAFGVLPFIAKQVKTTVPNRLSGAMCRLWLLGVASVIVLLGTFGQAGIRRMEMPILQLMAGTKLAGEFLERFEIVWLALLLGSLLFALGSLVFYGGHIAQAQGKAGFFLRLVMGILIYVGSLWGNGDNGGLQSWYPRCAAYFYLPVLFFFTVIVGLLFDGSQKKGQPNRTEKAEKPEKQKQTEKLKQEEKAEKSEKPEKLNQIEKASKSEKLSHTAKSIQTEKEEKPEKPRQTGTLKKRSCAWLFFSLLFLMCGCGGVGPENRAYPMTILADHKDGEWQIIYDMADVQRMTGKEKQGGGNGQESSEGSESGSGQESSEDSGSESGSRQHFPNGYSAGSLEEIRHLYDKSSRYELDTGHVKGIILGENLLKQPALVEEFFNWLDADRSLGKNALVFAAENPEKIMEARGKLDAALGVYLQDLYENREKKTRKAVTLSDVFFVWYNEDRVLELPKIVPSENGVRLA